VLVMTRRPGIIKAEIAVPRHRPGGRDWESFTADPGMQAICEQVLKLVRAERGLTGKPPELSPDATEVVA
jgi:NitT/TauT family transport system ATP-binding protein